LTIKYINTKYIIGVAKEGNNIVTDTSIAIRSETKKRLEFIKIHPRETFDDIINRLIDSFEKQQKQ
jgi:hypothetical protein